MTGAGAGIILRPLWGAMRYDRSWPDADFVSDLNRLEATSYRPMHRSIKDDSLAGPLSLNFAEAVVPKARLIGDWARDANSRKVRLLDYLVRAQQDRFRDRESEHFCSVDVNGQVELCNLLERQIGRLRSLEHLADEVGEAVVSVAKFNAVGDQPAGQRAVAEKSYLPPSHSRARMCKSERVPRRKHW